MRRLLWRFRVLLPGSGRSRLSRSMTLDEDIESAARLMINARHAIALTGAGVSTPSGIPDFRSPGSGMWTHYDPATVASIWNFRRHPEDFYDWVRPLAHKIRTAQPNPAHLVLAELESLGYLRSVVTQNIDELHQRAGSRHVLELHGHLREATCIRCFQIVPGRELMDRFLVDGQVPYCACGGVLKPNVVLYGEMLPSDVVAEAQHEIEQCDLMLIAGSSLEVIPASEMPEIAAGHGAKLIVVNLEPTPVDPLADVVIHADVAEVLPRIVGAMRRQKWP